MFITANAIHIKVQKPCRPFSRYVTGSGGGNRAGRPPSRRPAFYNRARRELLEGATIVPVIYKATLSERGSWEKFRDATFPLLARYLKSQGIDPEYAKSLVTAVFFRDRCHFREGVPFFNVLRDMEGLNSAALHFRILNWLSQTESVAAP